MGREPGIKEVDKQILLKERALRAWFIRDADPVRAQVDGLDIGWGGIQHWTTAQIPPQILGLHLDFACGYGTFLAQLGWRLPSLQLIGLNIDFIGPHAAIRPLLAQADVAARLVQADARCMPFIGGSIDSVSCFMGLQDIEIGFGESGIHDAASEAIRVLRPGGLLILVDEYPFKKIHRILALFPIQVIDQKEKDLDIHWNREVAEAAIRLYAQGWLAQQFPTASDKVAKNKAYRRILRRMQAQVESQIANQGYYVPFGPMRMVIAQKTVSKE
jgi:SAM-dependent methyltransferase